MTVFMVEPKEPGVPVFCIWKCWCKKTSRPMSWEGRWFAYGEAKKSWFDHIRKDHYKGRVWPNSKFTVDDLLKTQEKRIKRTIKVKKRKGKS